MIGEIRFDPSFKDADRTPMPLSRTIPLLLALLFLGTLTVAPPAGPHQKSRADRAMLDPTAQAPTDAELRDRREKLIANQHADDEALNLYDRIERHVELTDGPNPRVLDDRTYRVVPTGGGTMKILLRDHSEAVSAEEYRHQLEAWRDVLETMSTPGNSKGDAARAKYEKRQRQRAEFVEAAQDAFLPKWIGRETCTGHPCDVFELNPNPAFHPRSMFQDALAHVAAKIWVDRDSEQLVRGEASVVSDIYFFAGIAGKVYRGSRVEMEQSEVAPGIWLPTHYEYDFAGRKFLFHFSQHETIDVTQYRRIGPPREALADVKKELASGKGPVGNL
jgi:hypothetical protein